MMPVGVRKRLWLGGRVVAFVTTAILVFSGTLVASGAPSAESFTGISAGVAHTCVVTGAGGVKCWGSNRFGQLGNGVARPCNAYGRCSQRFNRTPVAVVGLGSRVKSVSAGGSHTCALTSLGGVKCWGYNATGQLGNGQKTCKAVETCSKNASSTPVDVVGLTRGVSAIAAGEFHTCALTSGGAVKCWGSQTHGELGNGTGESSSIPVDVVGLTSEVSAIDAGSHSTCAVTSGGTVRCLRGSPFAIAGLPAGVTAIAMGGTSGAGSFSAHACALMRGGGVMCWGDNGRGELGNGSLKFSPTAVDVVGLGSGVSAIAASASHTCALTNRGEAKCWGDNTAGELGNGSATGGAAAGISIPVGVVGLTSPIKAIAAGHGYTCALIGVSGVKCWGANALGTLGNGSKADSSKPVDVRFSARPSAKPPGSSTTARCSKAAATPIVKRLHLGAADFLPDPVAEVFCGAVMGPSSRTMVVVLASGGASSPIAGWAVFRLAGGTWQLVMERKAGYRVTAAGSDIRETAGVMREGDSHCCPTGGTKARLWRWNGTRFTAGPWKQVTPGAAASSGGFTSGYFRTPSGNIQCDYGYGKGPGYVRCGIKSGLKPPPPRRGPACSQSNRVSLSATGRTRTGTSICPGEPEGDAGPFAGEGRARVLGYGKTWSGGGLSCASAVTGLTCRNKSGHGFFLSRAHWRAF